MSKPTDFVRDNLEQRAKRLAKFLQHLRKGEDVPLHIVDEACRLVREALDRWDRERKAGEN